MGAVWSLEIHETQGSHGGENLRLSTFWVWLRVAQSRWLVAWSSQIATVPSKFATGAVCNAAQCWARQQWWRRSRYKRHNFGFWDWDRMAWAPELQPRPKWYQMIAIRPLCLERAQTESAVRGLFIHEMLRNHCYSALKYVISCGLHSKIGAAQKTLCPFSYTFLHYIAEKRGLKQREEILDVSAYLEIDFQTYYVVCIIVWT